MGALVVTRGGEGSVVRRGALDLGVQVEADRTEIPVVKAERVVDPTGCGDAYRSGILHAIANGLSSRDGRADGQPDGLPQGRATHGPQSVEIDWSGFRARIMSASSATAI